MAGRARATARTGRIVAAAALLLALPACGASAEPARSPGPGDAARLADFAATAHVDPWHEVARSRFRAQVERLERRAPELGRDELLVELMRLLALLGARDGHSGIFPLDPAHRRPLHLYPVRLFQFDDGLRVAAQVGGSDLVGARLVSIGGVPAARVAALARPLVPADNAQSLRARLAQWLVVAEVLHGLGVARSASAATFRFERPDGRTVARRLVPLPASRYAAAFPDLFHPMVPQGLPRAAAPAFLARRGRESWTAPLAGGRVVYVAYNVTLGSSHDVALATRRLASAAAVRGIVLDLRHNPGGENAAYEPLLETLRALGRRERLVVLVSRTTFSAAANLLADLERTAPVALVGEPSGGSPNLIGDPAALVLPRSGWSANVGTVWWRKSKHGADDARLAFVPDVRVPVRWRDLAAGRDAALDAALRLAGG